MDENSRRKILKAARNEITEHRIYHRLANKQKSQHNKDVLENIANQELAHYKIWREELGGQDVEPSRFKVWLYTTLATVLGLNFGLKLMEKGELVSAKLYQELSRTTPRALEVMQDEQKHEEELIGLLKESAIGYVSSFVLGLNDALVELTGALAGLTLALQDTRLIAVVGLITGIAASIAMAASEYLSTKEENGRNAIRAGAITGVAYFITVILLITPYLLITNAFAALITTLIVSVFIILVFTFYTAIAKSLSFKKKFLEMATISFGAAIINFGIGFAIKHFFSI